MFWANIYITVPSANAEDVGAIYTSIYIYIHLGASVSNIHVMTPSSHACEAVFFGFYLLLMMQCLFNKI